MADITSGTNNEFGFDYLRDNMSNSPEDLVQRKHHYAIVDEVDSVLIDDALDSADYFRVPSPKATARNLRAVPGSRREFRSTCSAIW